jgi:hypothetical protein
MDEKKIDLKLSFDAKNDVLYFSFGEPREAYSLEVEDGVFARIDPETNHAVGVTVVDFYKTFAEHPDKMLSFPMLTEIGLRFAHT